MFNVLIKLFFYSHICICNKFCIDINSWVKTDGTLIGFVDGKSGEKNEKAVAIYKYQLIMSTCFKGFDKHKTEMSAEKFVSTKKDSNFLKCLFEEHQNKRPKTQKPQK